MTKQNDQMTLIVLGVLGVMVLSRDRAPGPAPAPTPSGPLAFQGGLRSVSLSSGMAATLDKAAGSNLMVNFRYVFNATQNGVSISRLWPVRFQVLLGHSTLFGWKLSSELGFNGPGRLLKDYDLPSSASSVLSNIFMFTTPDDDNQVWDIHVKMFYAQPDAFGNPTTDYQQLGDELNLDGAIRSVKVVYSFDGSLSNIVVGQAQRQDSFLSLLQSTEYIPAFRTKFNPGFGQASRGSRGPFRQGTELLTLLGRHSR